MPDFEPIVGRYLPVDIDGERHRIFIEEAGSGIPLLCLHTAGNDTRQFRHIMNDPRDHRAISRHRVRPAAITDARRRPMDGG